MAEERQQLALIGGYPDGIWTCAWCAAELTDGAFTHRDDCRWISDIRAAERERIRQMAIRNAAVCTGDEGTSCYFADLIREEP